MSKNNSFSYWGKAFDLGVTAACHACPYSIVYFLTLSVSQLIANYLETAVNEHVCVLNLVVYVRNATTFYLTLVEGKLDKK